MAVKYHCKKCGKRFVDWGAEKLGFKCPDDEEELVRTGQSDEKAAKRPALKRRVKKVVAPIPLEDEELLVEDDSVESEEVVEEEDGILLEGDTEEISEGDDEVFPLEEEEEAVADVDDEETELEVGEEQPYEAAPIDDNIEVLGDWKA